MSTEREMKLALFIDFDNIALGARAARQRFDVKLLVHRVLEKGKIIVKRAYADWHYYKEHMIALHETAIELIEVPMPRISGKNSADIKMVVDAMDLCYSKDHIDTFVLVTGDSDFSPLVSKLRENDKRVIGIGMKNSSSKLLIGNCDEFIFYDDIFSQVRGRSAAPVPGVSGEKGELFGFLIETVQSLLQESRGVLYGSLIKDTMTRKRPDFNERTYGYSTFGDLLEDARKLGLLEVERDAKAGGTWVVQGLGSGAAPAKPTPVGVASSGAGEPAVTGGTSRSSRRRRRSSDRSGRRGRTDQAPADAKGSDGAGASQSAANQEPAASAPEEKKASAQSGETREEKAAGGSRKKTTKKAPAKKTTTKKSPAKKAVTKKAPIKKAVTKKAPAKKTVTKKKVTKKAPAKKAPSRKNSATD